MGGKVWSDEEERVFWEAIIPQSPSAANPADQKLKWPECAALMKEIMGDGARRDYTGTMLYEHHYQNFNGPKPRAQKYFEKYQRDAEWYKTHDSPPESTSASSAPPAPPRSPPKALKQDKPSGPRTEPRPILPALRPSQGDRLVIRDRSAGEESSNFEQPNSSEHYAPPDGPATTSTHPVSGSTASMGYPEGKVFSNPYYQPAVRDMSRSVIPADEGGKGASRTISSTRPSAYPTLPSIPSFYKEMTEGEAGFSDFEPQGSSDSCNDTFSAERTPNTSSSGSSTPVNPLMDDRRVEEFIASATASAQRRQQRDQNLRSRTAQNAQQRHGGDEDSSDKGKRKLREAASDDEEPAHKRLAPSEGEGRDRDDQDPDMSQMYHPNYAGWKFPFNRDQ